VAITGVAGPGGTKAKPEGLVHFACARRGAPTLHRHREYGPRGRAMVRSASIDEALDMLIEAARGDE
jgi:nicotinamide-nucleotide amidase